MRDDDHRPESQFGDELRRLRQQSGLTLRELAKQLNRSHSSIVDYEGAGRLAPIHVVQEYEDHFGLTPGSLLALRERAYDARRLLDGPPTDALCPYKGLEAFQYNDARLFFGREAEVEQVLTRLATSRFFTVIGPSGSGKSSFVRAGVLVGLNADLTRDDAHARIVILAPGEHPLDELAGRVNDAVDDDARLGADDLRSDPARLASVTRNAGTGLTIVVDQFEELFTRCQEQDERRCFVDALMSAWRGPASTVSLILTLRADFYGHLGSYPELAAAVKRNHELLAPMLPGNLRRAIERPAEICRLRLQPGLAQTMLEDLTDEPGALPLLSHALLETWKHRDLATLTVQGYREAGGVHGAIARTAESTYQELGEADQAIAQSIFLRLMDIGEGSEPARRRVDRADLAAVGRSSESLDRVLGVLAEARLITIEADTVVVAHEALIRHWNRLQGWIEADRTGLLIHRRLTDAAREWATLGREGAALYRGARLATTSEWAAEHEQNLSDLEQRFLTASQAAERDELASARRRARRLRLLASGLGALAVTVALLAVWAVDQRDGARREADKATSLALSTASTPLLNSRPDAALGLAFEAHGVSARPEARSALVAAFTTLREQRLTAILSGHSGYVYDVAFSPDGGLLATAGDSTVRLWDTRTRQLEVALRGHAGLVISVAFSPDGHTLATASGDKTARLWDLRSHKQIGAPLRAGADAGTVYNVAFSPDGRTLATASADDAVHFWDTGSRKRVGAPLRGHTAKVQSVAFSPDGRTLATASADRSVRLWDSRGHKQIGGPLRGHSDKVYRVAFSPDGRIVASASADGTVRLWDVRTHQQIGSPLVLRGGPFFGVAFSPDGRSLATGSYDNLVRLWDVRTHERIGAPLRGHAGTIINVAFSPDGRTLASASSDNTARLWTPRVRDQLGAPIRGHHGRVEDVAYRPDGRVLASSGDDGTVRLWDARTHRQLGRPLLGHSDKVFSLAFSPDGRMLVSASGDRTLRLWDPRSHGQIGAPLTGHKALVLGVAFNPDGRTLASAGADQEIRLWDARTHRPLGAPLRGHTAAVAGVAFSPDGQVLASAGEDRTVRLWDVRTRHQLGKPLLGHTGNVFSVAFSPDGRTLASASDDNTVRLWNPGTHRQIGAPLRGHVFPVNDVGFSSDGRTLASGSSDHSVRLWDPRTRRQLGVPLRGHGNSVINVTFSPDGRTLATASYDSSVRQWTGLVWRGDDELKTRVCGYAAGLSPRDWTQFVSSIPYRNSCD